MWQRFVESSRKIVLYAQIEAGTRGGTDVAAEHLLLGLLREVAEEKSVWPPAPTDRVNPHDIAASLLHHVDLARLRAETDRQITQLALPTGKTAEQISLLPSGKAVIDVAYAEARRLSSGNITPEFLLLGLFGPKTGGTASLLTQAGLDLETARREVAAVYQPAQEQRAKEDIAKDKNQSLWTRLFAKRTAVPGEEDTL